MKNPSMGSHVPIRMLERQQREVVRWARRRQPRPVQAWVIFPLGFSRQWLLHCREHAERMMGCLHEGNQEPGKAAFRCNWGSGKLWAR